MTDEGFPNLAIFIVGFFLTICFLGLIGLVYQSNNPVLVSNKDYQVVVSPYNRKMYKVTKDKSELIDVKIPN